jgi:hypothetical protein
MCEMSSEVVMLKRESFRHTSYLLSSFEPLNFRQVPYVCASMASTSACRFLLADRSMKHASVKLVNRPE